MRTLVLGLGNEYAGDDAVGVLAVRALRGKLAGGADVVESAASGLALLEVFAGYDRAVIADSIRTGRSPAGTIVEVRLADLGLATAPSLHQAGIPELTAVARRLGMGFPDQTRVLAVEVAGPLMFGAPLSKPVAAAVAPLGRRVLEQVQRWASEDSRRGRPAGAGRGSRLEPLVPAEDAVHRTSGPKCVFVVREARCKPSSRGLHRASPSPRQAFRVRGPHHRAWRRNHDCASERNHDCASEVVRSSPRRGTSGRGIA